MCLSKQLLHRCHHRHCKQCYIHRCYHYHQTQNQLFQSLTIVPVEPLSLPASGHVYDVRVYFTKVFHDRKK